MFRSGFLAALALALAATLAVSPTDSEAKRLGGGKSTGTQRAMPERTSPDATPAKPAQTPNAAPTQAPGAAAAPAAAPKRNWLGPLAGLAAGLGLAALMSHLGLGEEFGQFLMLALIVLAVIAAVMYFRRRMAGPAQPALAGAGAGSATGADTPMQRTQVAWPQQGGQGSQGGAAALAPAAAAGAPLTAAFVPAAFDSESFERIAKAIFIRLQAANDAANLDDLRQFTTPEMYAALKMDLLERGSAPQATEVQQVDAKVVDVAEEADRQVVSVRYKGLVVEAPGAAPEAFDEVWHLVRPRGGEGGWQIAGIEQMR
jgi:predicted lipid-binding transport protein (Tim44 family)